MIACVLVDGDQETEVVTGTELHRASLEWARFHDIDPMRVPAGSYVERDTEHCCVRYTEYVYDADDQIVIRDNEAVTRDAISQGEAPPLRFPQADA